MPRRKLGYSKLRSRAKSKILSKYQLSIGGLASSEKMLRLIEDVCEEDDEKLAKSFDDYASCSEIR